MLLLVRFIVFIVIEFILPLTENFATMYLVVPSIKTHQNSIGYDIHHSHYKDVVRVSPRVDYNRLLVFSCQFQHYFLLR